MRGKAGGGEGREKGELWRLKEGRRCYKLRLLDIFF